jgi:3,4-dihydroxy 2-butanone 4-phosphate synthase/GTP cyclohydrolase II
MINTTDEILLSIKNGEMVIIMDDENRENEGDLVMASQFVKPSDINFMASEGRGLICLTLTESRCKSLGLSLLKQSGSETSKETNFTVSIDALKGVTTGISASDRAKTIKAAVRKNAKPSDFAQPGHIFPIMAKNGGVLTRAGHTEAGCDLAKLAGLEPSSVIVEILNEDGSMARKKDLVTFAAKHKIKIGTIEDLIKYRVSNEKTIQRISQQIIKTKYGSFTSVFYKDILTENVHFVLIKNKISPQKVTLTRVHVQNTLTDTIGLLSPSSWPLDDALKKISKSKQGALVFITNIMSESDTSNIEVIQQKKSNKGIYEDYRTVGIGAQILNDIGVRKMNLMSAPKKYHGINAFGLEVVKHITK